MSACQCTQFGSNVQMCVSLKWAALLNAPLCTACVCVFVWVGGWVHVVVVVKVNTCANGSGLHC